MFGSYKDTVFSLVDLETTGGSPSSNQVIEVALIQMKNGEIIHTYEQLLRADRPLPPFISGLTGITDDMLVDQPEFEDIAGHLMNLLEGTVFVAHNARFDYSFLKAEFSRLDMSLNLPTLCTVRLSRKLFPQYRKHSLDSLIERFDFQMDDRHRAFADTFALKQFFDVLPGYHSGEHIERTMKGLLKQYVLPSHVPEETLQALHKGPGVYVFYGEDNAPLYVGKSIHVKDRVFQHFAKAHDSTKELTMLQQMRTVETHPTVSELGALLLEARMVKQLLPLHNRRLRRVTNPLVLVRRKDTLGYLVPEERALGSLSRNELASILGIFPTRKNLQESLQGLKAEHKLCPILLGLEKGSGECFSHQLGRCEGACISLEDPMRYNLRFEQAFAATRVAQWPFKGPILIEERSENGSHGECFLVDQWVHLGSGTYSPEGEHFSFFQKPVFDRDSYKILARYVKSNRRNICPVSMQSMNERFG